MCVTLLCLLLMVSTPITWEELEASAILPVDLTPQVVLERVERLGGLFAPILKRDQHIAWRFSIPKSRFDERSNLP